MPLTFPLALNGYVLVSEDLLSLRFNIQVGTMYVKQELFDESGLVSEIISVQI